ncbi:MAG: methyltransferase [Clostridia bacterium]
MEIFQNERIDDLEYMGLKIIQDKSKYTFTSDSVLLANFVAAKPNDKFLDIGTGTGIVAILVAAKCAVKKCVAVEVQEEVASLAKRNVQFNGMDDNIIVVCDSIQNFSKNQKEAFDVIACNPPYKKSGTSFLNENSTRAISRHEILLNLKDLCESVKCALRFGGKFFVCFDANRTSELLICLSQNYLEPKRMFFTQSALSKSANLVFVEAVKGGKSGVNVLPVLVTNDMDGNYITNFIRDYKRG